MLLSVNFGRIANATEPPVVLWRICNGSRRSAPEKFGKAHFIKPSGKVN